jgi:hypothetical protein
VARAVACRWRRGQAVMLTAPCSGCLPSPQGGGGGLPNPFDMGKLMESVKKAQQLVQVETQRVQAELDA